MERAGIVILLKFLVAVTGLTGWMAHVLSVHPSHRISALMSTPMRRIHSGC